ncbi:3-oxoacyl-ACP synthase [Candidatus Pantoea edessiphila]|uniref:Beta-ketoacyl-[acyl-carrier-protein] synthase III n=1 Tax=Candidatus Pantoea edessiphila TaxID=2044610 RepID=A0A2P5SYU9_9GAMM|nr:beta-ketoacyl-ACP synthase III [Candidatus Pantoea edessiphila]MBK4775349.1 ketoacyl-ACP synthase III [Pantoea sp. Edef]PPI87518.1 3-oxoacyl-ACP synthase [Candidatus Pantoea edessiphila]
MFTRIIGTGSYLPLQIRTNVDLERMLNTSDEWIISRTGIKKRHIAESDETVASMGFNAAKNALKMANIKYSQIELIILATTSSSHAFPSSACMIQKMLGIRDCIAFDVAAACTGFVYALSIADQFIKNEKIKYALIIGSDVLSRTVDPSDRNSLILFGDGAGAVVLSKSNKPGIISTHLHSNATYAHLLTLPYQYSNVNNKQPVYIQMSGNEVFKIAIEELTHIVHETLEANHFNIDMIDWFIPHQANLRIILAIVKKLGINLDKVAITIDRHGNTSAASVPSALDEIVRNGCVKLGQIILLKAFGSGFTWGSALIRF